MLRSSQNNRAKFLQMPYPSALSPYLRNHAYELDGFYFLCLCIGDRHTIILLSFFFRRLAVYKPKEKEQSQQHPVLVIICARDEDENIARNFSRVLFKLIQLLTK